MEEPDLFIPSPQPKVNNSMQQSPMSVQKARREAQWQLEREEVSRQAQMASNSRSAVYIESDESDAEIHEYEAGVRGSYDEQPAPYGESESEEEPDDFEPDLVPEPLPRESQAVDLEPLDEEEDGYDDIWQLEANDHDHISEHSEDERLREEAAEAASPWRDLAATSSRQNHWSSSPGYVDPERDSALYYGPSKVRELREQKVDLDALLAEEDTPNRAQYYNGTSTPRAMLNRRLGTQRSPLNGSPLKDTVSRTPAHIRLQPLSQSPDVPRADESPRVSHQSPHVEHSLEEDDSVSNAALGRSEPVDAPLTSTPRTRQPNGEHQGSSWFKRITSFTPQWLKAPTRARSSSVTTIPEESEYEDDDEVAHIESAKEVDGHLDDEPLSRQGSQSPASPWRQVARSPPMQEDNLPAIDDEKPFFERSVSQELVEDATPANDLHEASSGRRPLAVFGYFSDAHYIALRRIYQIAKRYPERFEYFDSPGRAAIIGDWIWTSDGHHGVPITEIQFAIIDRFAQELSRADIQYGGSGHVDWTEADLHRRLISIIIGEQIREERKAKANRGTSVDTWR
jgi:hypothetical protein